jgi:hypothetical protein
MGQAFSKEEQEFRDRLDGLAPRIRAMANKDPMCHMLMMHYARGGFDTYEDFLEHLVFHLYDQKEIWAESAKKLSHTQPPPPIIVKAEPGSIAGI